jgi:hypothetical protein
LRDAGGVDDAGDVAEAGGRLDQRVNRCARRDVQGDGVDLEAGARQNFSRRVGIFLTDVSEQDMLARTHPTRDGLADRPGSDHDDDAAHGVLLRA